MKELFEEIVSEVKKVLPKYASDAVMAKTSVIGAFNGGFCPEIQHLRIDALEKCDWPYGISLNSIFMDFRFDLKEKKITIFNYGHIWLSPSDKEREEYKYFAMRSMVEIASEKGVKKFRKYSIKNPADAAEKIAKYYGEVMKAVTEYTGGYPYKQGI